MLRKMFSFLTFFFPPEEKQVHILINNAGVMCYPEAEKTEDGHEIQFATNYLGSVHLEFSKNPGQDV